MQKIVVFADSALRTDTVLDSVRYLAQLLFNIDDVDIEYYPDDVSPEKLREMMRYLTWDKGYSAHYFFLCYHHQIEELLPILRLSAVYAYFHVITFDYPVFLPHDQPRDKAEWLTRDWRNALDRDGNWIGLYWHERM